MPAFRSTAAALALAALLVVPTSEGVAGVMTHAAPAPAARVGARATPPRANTHRHPTASRRADNRARIVEGNLKDLSRSLEATRPAPVRLPEPSKCPGCAERAELNLSEQQASELALRGNLHRLKRETRIRQQPDRRKTQVEESITPPRAQ